MISVCAFLARLLLAVFLAFFSIVLACAGIVLIRITSEFVKEVKDG